MITISIIGSGNVAHHLIDAIEVNEHLFLQQVLVRDKSKVLNLIAPEKIIVDSAELKIADLFIISVKDDAIQEVSNKLPFSNQLVAHTSGTKTIEVLNSKNKRAVFYPLQTFSKSKSIDFSLIPICLEAENDSDYLILNKVAQELSKSVYKISSDQRKALHVAAVFVSNFVNNLYSIGEKICNDNQMPFDILKPLIQETAHKILSLNPNEAQTGPARRNDIKTIETHLDFLKDESLKNLYQLLTENIKSKYGN